MTNTTSKHQDKINLSSKLIVGIALMPFIFSWFTLKDGYTKRARTASFLWLILNLLIVVGDSETVGAKISAIFFLCACGMLSAIIFGKWHPWVNFQKIANKKPHQARGIPTNNKKAKTINISHYSREELLEIAFSYIDSNKNYTQREVSVKQITDTHIKGWCHERKAIRTFRIDSIILDVTLRSSGEVIPLNSWVKAVERIN
ncbi:hypothetical protein LA374_00340 [Aeromonas schubertii]|uniref:WYL domain-containing protein n=1 Tax=Aeromonas schubertii TaxID=652 RepID=A0ABS7V6F2_9GAMM|nr:hypothetical protein [Aeromonas schubertii]MBZ6064666.1 hypothetical protein [Aeromonas schubertii]